MALHDGEPADAWDVWTRVITDNNYWKDDGTLHNSAFGGKAIAAPTKVRSWTHELSGRLLSLITDLEQESIAFCTAVQRDFAGIMFQKVENLRSSASGFHTDVVYTPKVHDNAHGDFVAFDTTDENRFEIRDWLQDFIQHVRPDKLSAVETLRQ
jgi:hypothetical protein